MHQKTSFLALLGLLVASFGASSMLRADPVKPVVTVVPALESSLLEQPGLVELLIQINAHGYVTDAKIKSSTNPQLNQACLAAIRQWRYTSASGNAGNFVQPLRFGDATFDAEVAVTARPKALSRVAPEVPEALQNISGKVTVAVQLDAAGKLTDARIVSSTHEELNPLCLAAVQAWRFAPAYEAGQGKPSLVYVPFAFVGREMPEAVVAKTQVVDNATLKPLRQDSPSVPEALASVNAAAVIDFVVDANGYVANATVKSTTNPELGELARQAVKGWTFRPVIKNGVAVPSRAEQPFKFGEGVVSVTPVDKLPRVRSTVSPDFPAELAGASGFAKVRLEIDENGQVVAADVTQASHDVLKAPVLAAARQWKFYPAIRAGQQVKSSVTVPFVFGST